jgi:hypothetical protein
VLTGFTARTERGDSSKVGSAVGDSSEVRSAGGDLAEMGLTNSTEVEGISGKRSCRGST